MSTRIPESMSVRIETEEARVSPANGAHAVLRTKRHYSTKKPASTLCTPLRRIIASAALSASVFDLNEGVDAVGEEPDLTRGRERASEPTKVKAWSSAAFRIGINQIERHEIAGAVVEVGQDVRGGTVRGPT